MALELVTRLIADRRLGNGSGPPEALPGQYPLTWESRVERAGKVMTGASMLAFCLLMVTLVPLGMAHLKATESIVLWIVEILAIILLGGVGLLNLPRIVRGIQSKRPPQPASIRRAEATKQLAGSPSHESRPSIAEATTRSLERIDHD
jgi:hypothetical protein